jgi:hypothetical protein
MYSYKEEKEKLFTDQGQRKFLKVRDITNSLIGKAGAVTLGKVFDEIKGDSFECIACLDRMVELGEIIEVPTNDWAQYRIFTCVN